MNNQNWFIFTCVDKQGEYHEQYLTAPDSVEAIKLAKALVESLGGSNAKLLYLGQSLI